MNNESNKSPTTSTSLSSNSAAAQSIIATTKVSSLPLSSPSLQPASKSTLYSASSSYVSLAAIIPDTPIVSIAGSTLSEITTTTTSTKTTPTPVPTTKQTAATNKNTNKNDDSNKDRPSNLSSSAPSFSSSSGVSNKDQNPMSVANSSIQGALSNATGLDENSKQTPPQQQQNSTTSKGSSSNELLTKQDSTATASAAPEASSSPSQSVAVTATAASKTDENISIPNENKSKDFLSESWEESRLKDWDDSKLKELLDEAYSYKNPRDKENKSKTFLQLLEKAENEDQSYPFRAITTRGSRNVSNSIASNSYHHYQNTHYHSHIHNHHNRSHHHHKQGGSLQDLLEIGLHESQLDCDSSFGVGIGGNQRTRRQNHNSRQKKYSSTVSSRQREGGSLPSNVNAAHHLSAIGGHELGFMQQEATGKASKKEQRRKGTAAATTTVLSQENKESAATNTNTIRTGGDPPSSVSVENASTADTAASSHVASGGGGDFIIDMGEPMMDIQQQQKILQSKGQDSAKQGQSFYERLTIPRVNLIGSTKGSYFAPTTADCYVDETVRFNTLERNGNTNSSSNASSTIDAKFLPLDENYKSCKSVLGGNVDGEKSPDILGKTKPNSIYTKITSPASGSFVIGGAANHIPNITQRQLDENGNALSELYQNSSSTVGGNNANAAAATTMQINCVPPTAVNAGGGPGILLTSCGGNNVSTSATVTLPPHPTSTTVSTSATITTYASGPSQAKAKAKKKSQQERNTKTVDVRSLAGYRGVDPVEDLVKYIESTGEGGGGGGGGGGSNKTNDKKKERKKEKDKEKHQKLKKSNSLEELRSGAKMEVHELKRTAATTESNAVVLRQKSSTAGGAKQHKNSASTADINKNLEGKNNNNNNYTNTRKNDRRSWGNEDLKYLEDQQNANEVTNMDLKTTTVTTAASASIAVAAAVNLTKERKQNKASLTKEPVKDEKETKDKTAERNERNLSQNVLANHNNQNNIVVQQQQTDVKVEKQESKGEKVEKSERRKRYDTPPNAVTIIDIVPMESSCPETAEFHVVTKKKKPKKPKVINNTEETSVTFNRTHNFTIQKSTALNQQPRYKYYQHDGNYSSGNQQHQQQTFNANASQHHHHQQHHHQGTHENFNNTSNADKSRRKSTSSVPPSEKSDSSDLDSVHSLPIEPTNKANAAKESTHMKKGAKLSVASNNNTTASNKNTTTAHVPISYADIARTNKEIADAAAAAAAVVVNNVTSSTNSNVVVAVDNVAAAVSEVKNVEILNSTTPNDILAEDKPNVINTNANTKQQKSKKSQIKQDFPELVGPPISYSQSLAASSPATMSSAAVNVNTQNQMAAEVLPTDPLVANKTSTNEQSHHNHPATHHTQMLQKSKSVENDNPTSNLTNSTSSSSGSASASSSSFMTPLNSNNLDQQYPALEKTMKRHSSANVGMNYTTTANQPVTSSFNFAAAAKQQISTNCTESTNVNCNRNLALTTSTNANTQTALQAGVNNATISTTTTTGIIHHTSNTTNSSNNNNTNRKSKEKSPPITTQNTLETINAKKSKKERHMLQQQQTVDAAAAETNNTTSQTKLGTAATTSKKSSSSRTQLKSSNSLPLTATTQTNPRPAVIILNDDRNSSGYHLAENQFTFGDFNEDELKLFEDDNNTSNHHQNNILDSENNAHEQLDNVSVEGASLKSSPPGTYFNDSGASCENDIMVNNSASDMLLNSTIDTSSPNTSFVHSHHTQSVNTGSAGGNTTAASGNNQSSDSGIYTDKIKTNSSSSKQGGTSTSKQNKQMSPTKEDHHHRQQDNKLNTFLSNTKCTSVHTSMDNLDPLPPPQQLETCNDIETAIIEAARREAAKHQHKSSSSSATTTQQQQFKNSNTSSNSSSFSSSSLSSTTSSTAAAASAPYNSNNHNRNYSHYHQQQQKQSNQQQQQQSQYDDDADNDDVNNAFVADTPRSRSPSHPRRISIQFIPPTVATAFSTQQHNEIIVDFIGSAWEEIANSKVTRVYDGQ